MKTTPLLKHYLLNVMCLGKGQEWRFQLLQSYKPCGVEYKKIKLNYNPLVSVSMLNWKEERYGINIFMILILLLFLENYVTKLRRWTAPWRNDRLYLRYDCARERSVRVQKLMVYVYKYGNCKCGELFVLDFHMDNILIVQKRGESTYASVEAIATVDC